MPKRTDINSIMILGAGPIVIGQACEFDYSGTQACKVLKEEGYKTILVNSNPATIMTDPELADLTYVEPITPEIVAMIIEKERPDALLPTMGGQTALNCSLSLHKAGILKKYGVEMIGATPTVVDVAEDRGLFRDAMSQIGVVTPKSRFVRASKLKATDKKLYSESIAVIASMNLSSDEEEKLTSAFKINWTQNNEKRKRRYVSEGILEATAVLDEIGLPAVIRPSFTLGGTGGGIAYNKAEFLEIVERGLTVSPTTEILIEESVLGWKEYEMEVICDDNNNCIIVCSIENVNPMGVHTGDSVTVAPALTLTDKEYQHMRHVACKVVRKVGMQSGGANVQFAINPYDGRFVVIEMNPRVSRSSALASKATGFPIAKIAARLAVGYRMDELSNDITGGKIPASFEPSLDYVVVKVPRFAFDKFPEAGQKLTTSMKSVGEVMAIGRTFSESLQKAFLSLDIGLTGLNEIAIPKLGEGDDENAILAALGTATPDLLRYVGQAVRLDVCHKQIHQSCSVDPWFLDRIQEIVDAEHRIATWHLPKTASAFRMLKSMGFSDTRLAELSNATESEVRCLRKALGVNPVFKRVDTCAGEFAAQTPYMYSTYEEPFADNCLTEVFPSNRKKIIILGSGPNAIGQGIEFDYCCCHAAFALRKVGYEVIMVNCNPETVSTDYDTSDRLYFEPLTVEHVLEIIQAEERNGSIHGVIVQFGGQTSLLLTEELEKNGVKILGVTSTAINLAEGRDSFRKLLSDLGLKQPRNGVAYSVEQSRLVVSEIGFPVVVRPSYVLGGRAIKIISDMQNLERYFVDTLLGAVPAELKLRHQHSTIDQIDALLCKAPLLFDSYLSGAIELDVDALVDSTGVFVAGIMEHIEEAGIHSGDSSCSLPPYSLEQELCDLIEDQTKRLVRAMNIIGVCNIQYAVKNGDVYVLEVNPRASRTIPFVAKVTGIPLAKFGARIIAGETLEDLGLLNPKLKQLKHIAVKAPVFPFSRFSNVNMVLGPEMQSTGESMGIDKTFAMAFAKAQIGSDTCGLPRSGTVFVSVRDCDKPFIVQSIRDLIKTGFEIVATRGTYKYLRSEGLAVRRINKVLEGQPHIVDAIKNDEIQLIFNTTAGLKALALSDSCSLRRAALLHNVPCYTTLAGAIAVSQAVIACSKVALSVYPMQSYVGLE